MKRAQRWERTRTVRPSLDRLWNLLALPLLVFISLPLAALFLRASFDDFIDALGQPQVGMAIRLSLVSSLTSTAAALLAGTPVAYILARRDFRFHHIVDTIVDLPTVLPPSVAGMALLMAFGRRGLLAPILALLGINIPFTLAAVVMAQTFVAAPFYVKAAAIGFSSIDTELKQAAALDGASRWQTFRYVTLPLSWTALVSGGVMTWARALGEFGATILFAGNFQGRTQTMPLAIYVGFETDINVAIALSIILVCFSFAILMVVKGLLYRRRETDPEIVDK
ncbi:MAG: molybdate ABC transporter permease subunit [Chloroflexi bacterium]|nr:molybdate ABC transporter permease subunit [Chloroflexota bacterium]NOG76399.1 molybdate ABC transporter permease subunit [Chloroflexota bacterium]